MAIKKAIELFLEDCAQSEDSSQTICDYRSWLSDFAEHLGPCKINEISLQDLAAFGATLDHRWEKLNENTSKSENKTSSVIANYLRAIRSLYEWLVKKGHLPSKYSALVERINAFQIDLEIPRVSKEQITIVDSTNTAMRMAATLLIEWLLVTESSGTA